ncbi:MAG: hypothetical protein WD627_04670 [Actinomycetota bacterium]
MRPALVLAILLILQASPAYAHPFTGGPSTAPQIAISIAGALATLVGLWIMLRSSPGSGAALARKRRWGLIVAAVGFTTFLLGPDLFGGSTPACVRPETQARIEIVSPSEGQQFPDGNVPVELKVTGGKTASVGSTQNRPGEGHLHLSVDGRLASMTGEAAQTLELPAGPHTLDVEYVANDHAPFCTRVIDSASFKVAGG